MAADAVNLGPYELQGRLGAGGMAETFAAVRRGPSGFEQRVCLKRILSTFEADSEFVRLFLEEARLSARLRHANIAQVVDFGVADGSHFLALELVEGLDLKTLLATLRARGEPFPSGLVSFLTFELGAALDFAHRAGPDGRAQGIVHRDISPSNILLSNAGEVKLTDFGIAKAMEKPGATRTGLIKGKFPYMAPEYALHGRCDARSDLFSLGVTLYECLAGERPFDGDNDVATVHRIQNGEHTPLAERVPTAPRTLTDAIERLIRPDPAERFANAAEMLDAVVEVAPPPTARRILGELVRRARALEQPAGSAAAPSESLVFDATRAVEQQPAAAPPPAASAPPTPDGPAEVTRTIPDTARTELDPAAADAGRAHGGTLRLGSAPPATPEQHGARDAGPTPTAALAGGRPARALWLLAPLLLLGGGAAALWALADGSDGPAPSPAVAPGQPERPEPVPVAAPAEPRPTAEGEPATAEAEPAAATNAEAAPRAGGTTESEDDGEAEGHGEPEPPAPEPPPPRAEAPPARAAPSAPAELHVVVVPFGEVWIDGKRAGSSPITVQLPAGRHVVAAGDGTPRRRREVRLRAGERRRVVLR